MQPEVAVIECRAADENPGFRSGKVRRTNPGIFECFPSEFEQQPLLRIHLFGLARGNAENGRIEAPDVVENARRPGITAASLLRPRMG